MSGSVNQPSMTTLEGRAALGRGWQDTGPVLRNRQGSSIDPFFLNIEEAIVWIATRDLKAVEGARAYMKFGEERFYPLDPGAHWHADVASQVLLSSVLRSDVAGHHPGCGSHADEHCTCQILGRRRYCRCHDGDSSTVFSCGCVAEAQHELHRALVEGMPSAGRLEHGKPFSAIERAAYAGVEFAFREADGLSFLPEYESIRIPRAEIEKRWPLDLEAQLEAKVPLEVQLDVLLAGSIIQGRPDDSIEGLRIFGGRLAAGKVLLSRLAEAEALSRLHSRRPAKATVSEWIGPFYKQLVWQNSRTINGSDIREAIFTHLITKVKSKLKPGADKR